MTGHEDHESATAPTSNRLPPTTPTFLSVGSLIIDDIVFKDGSLVEAQLGGGGVHALFGARVHLPPPYSRFACFIGKIGSDCPDSVIRKLDDIEVSLELRQVESEQTPRAWNIFRGVEGGAGDEGTRDFKFRTSEESYATKFRILPADLPRPYLHPTPIKYVHFVISPTRLLSWLSSFRALQQALSQTPPTTKPYVVWEPSPASCTPQNWSSFLSACAETDLVSPNHEEIADLIKGSEHEINPSTNHNSISDVIEMIFIIVTNLTQKSIPIPTICIRAGPRGCVIRNIHGKITHLPSYISILPLSSPLSTVVDVTGAGNAFLGG
ncbi:hypothetical protein HK097_005008, partial [Rhizophlyctis rosea]